MTETRLEQEREITRWIDVHRPRYRRITGDITLDHTSYPGDILFPVSGTTRVIDSIWIWNADVAARNYIPVWVDGGAPAAGTDTLMGFVSLVPAASSGAIYPPWKFAAGGRSTHIPGHGLAVPPGIAIGFYCLGIVPTWIASVRIDYREYPGGALDF